MTVLVSTSLLVAEAKKKLNDGTKKYEGDFEFAEEVSAQFKNIYHSKNVVKHTNTTTTSKKLSILVESVFLLKEIRFVSF